MAMVVKNNMSAVRTLNTLNANSSALQKSLNRVSSGMKINSAQDDAAGYAISERMRVRIRSLDQANQNTQNDSSLMKTAEGAVGNTVEILRALKEKAINAANDSNTDEDRQTIQKEINQFIDQIDDNALVQFNGKYLVDGSKNNAATSTKTVLLNQSLSKDNYAGHALTDLKNRAGDSLGIQNTDKFQVSWVQNGVVSSTSGDVGSQTLDDILKAAKIPGTVARTDDYGLVGTSEASADPMANYDPSGMTVASGGSVVTGLNSVQGLFADENSHIGSVFTSPAATGNIARISGYHINNEDVDTEVDIIVKCVTNASSATDNTNAVFNVYLAEKGKDTPLTLAEDEELFSVKVPTSTLVDKDGTTPKTDQPGYINPPKEDSTTFAGFTDDTTNNKATLSKNATGAYNLVDTLFSTSGTNSGNISTTVNTTPKKNLADLGYYTLVDDGNGGQKYTQDSTKTMEISFDATGDNLEISNYNKASVTLYKFDENDLPTKVSLADFGKSATKDFKVTPKADITVEVYDDSPKVSDPCDKSKKDVYTPDKTAGIAFVAEKAGVKDQISGLTINIMDQDGNVKKAANAALDQFKQYQRAENETGDMSLNFHIGSEANVAIKVGLSDMRSEALGLKGSNGTRIDVYTKEHANAAINVIENALTKALDQQTTIGAIEARLEYTSTNLTTSSENVQAAESTIRDADMAKEMTNYTKSNVLLQAAQAMLAQANQNSSAVLSLLQ